MLLLRCFLAVTAYALLAGCGTNPDGETTNKSMSPNDSKEVMAGPDENATKDESTKNAGEIDSILKAANTDVSLAMVDYDGLMKRVNQEAGRIVVLDIWSTSCVPCMQEFPHLVELSKRAPKRVSCFSLNVDYFGSKKKGPETYMDNVLAFLKKQNATTTNLLSIETDEDMRAHFGVSAIPAIVIFGIDGEIAHVLTDSNASGNGLTYSEDVIPAVEAMLSAQK